jgi:hypothetical protein
MKPFRSTRTGKILDGRRRVYVFLAKHVFEYSDGHDNLRVIGVFSSDRKARAAIRQVRKKPGFRERKRKFEVSRCVLDSAYWTEGYGGGPLSRLGRAAK